MLRHFFFALVIMGLPLLALGAEPPAVDLVIENALVWSGDPKHPKADTIAISGNRLLFIGERQDWNKIRGGQSIKKTIDAKGKLIVPGFYDSHVHMLGSGRRLSQVALKSAADEAEFGKRLSEFHKKLPRDRWMLGGEWDHDRALGGKLPTAALLDKYVKDRPVFLRRYDGHMGVINTRALQMAGITEKTKDPIGGVIYRDSAGKPTGLLRDNAMSLVERLIPRPDETEIAEALRAALDEARRNGVTSVQDMDGSDGESRRRLFRLYQALAKENKLSVRVDLRWPLAAWRELADLGVAANFGNDWVRIGGVKGFVDGSLGSSTAKMFEPYVNEPNSRGVFVTPPARLREYILGADKAGLSVAVHAIGDEANATLLDIFSDVSRQNGPRDRRFRIEHAQHLRPADYRRFKELGVIPSMQPFHIVDDGRWAEGRIGGRRCASSYANRSLLEAGAVLAFGSDWSVAPLNPLLGIDAAVNRRTLDGKHPGGWYPEQKITVEQALTAYTYGSAYAAFQERERGRLRPGYLADFVMLSRDILDPKERDKIAETEILMTVVGGRVVYEKEK